MNRDFLTVSKDENLNRVSCTDSRRSDILYYIGDNKTSISS